MTSFKIKIPAIKTIILIATTVAVFIFLTRFIKLDFKNIISIQPSYILRAILITLCFFPLSAARWYFILQGLNIQTTYRKVMIAVIGSGPLALLPGRLGDFSRVFIFPNNLMARAAGSIVFEKIIDVLVLMGMAAAGCAAAGLYLLSAGLAGLILLSIFGFLGFSHIRKMLPQSISGRIGQAHEASKILALDSLQMSKIILSSLINWSLSMVQVYILFQATGQIVPLSNIFAYMPLAIFAGLLPITIAGLGTRDSVMILFFAPLAGSIAVLTVSIWYFLLSYGVALILGIPFLPYLLNRHQEE